MSDDDPLEIVIIKGFDSGIGSLLIAFTVKAALPSSGPIPAILLLGFVSYGLNIFSYICVQRILCYGIVHRCGGLLIVFLGAARYLFFCGAGDHSSGDIFCGAM